MKVTHEPAKRLGQGERSEVVFVDNWRGGVDDEGYLRQELGPPMHDAVAGSANAKQKYCGLTWPEAVGHGGAVTGGWIFNAAFNCQ